MNDAAIHAHVDAQLAGDPASARPIDDRVALAAGALVPIYGSYRLDHRVFGGVRPSAIVFDWVLGAIVPLGLVAASFAADASTANVLRWTCTLGLYGATRVGHRRRPERCVILDEYDRYLEQKTRVVAATVRF